MLCNTVVKSNLLWPAHLQSRGHKEVRLQKIPYEGLGRFGDGIGIFPRFSAALQKEMTL